MRISRRIAYAAALALAAPTVAAQHALPASAPISDIHYDVAVDSASASRRTLTVTMTFHTAGPRPVVLALPAWSPGHYTLLWFVRKVSQFAVTAQDAPLPWRHLDYQTWQIVPPAHAATVRVAFAYRADTVDRAAAYTRPDFTFFNGTNLFLYPVGRGFDWPATVAVHAPEGWRIATGMAAGHAPHTFGAANYHDLVDMPFFVGHFALDSAPVAGTGAHWMRLAMYPDSTATAERRTRYLKWLTAFAPVEGAVFHDVPWQTYTVFLLSDTAANSGGLEHQDSQMDELIFRQLDLPRVAALFAHEMFHAWNVKRLRPADLVPYRYDDAQPTGWLWVSEGITDYYANVAQLRSGTIDSTAFLGTLAQTIGFLHARPAVAPADASMSAWVAPVDGSNGMYYAQGAELGFLLDIAIRNGSENHHSLDEVMRELYNSTYKRAQGFTPLEWWGAVSRASGGASFADFHRRFVEGREPFPYDSILPLAGLRLVADTAHAPATAGGASPPRLKLPPYTLEIVPGAAPRAARVLRGILHGTTEG